ncbi:MAG: hypothetical protein ACXWAT_03155, partial [Methylobacter sp.]
MKVLYLIRPRKLFTTENTNDCMDAGGRATHGAVAEDTEKIILLTQPIRISMFSVSSVVTLGFFLKPKLSQPLTLSAYSVNM